MLGILNQSRRHEGKLIRAPLVDLSFFEMGGTSPRGLHLSSRPSACRPGDRIYRLGVLVDTAEHYRHLDVVERDLTRPRLLEDFGWRIESVLTKDWYERRQQVLDRLLERLAEAP